MGEHRIMAGQDACAFAKKGGLGGAEGFVVETWRGGGSRDQGAHQSCLLVGECLNGGG